MSKTKMYQVNWNIFGSIDVKANNEEEAREIVYIMQHDRKKELQDKILEEAANGFDVGTIEKIEM